MRQGGVDGAFSLALVVPVAEHLGFFAKRNPKVAYSFFSAAANELLEAEPRSSGRISGARPIGVPQSSAADARALSNNMTAATIPKLRTVYLQIRDD